MATVRLDLSYDGSGFRGYARQNDLRTVQGELELALAKILGATPETAVAGRTDAGVHARGQVVSFPVVGDIDLVQLERSLNGLLGPEMAILSATLLDDGFHARHSAIWRRYRYRIGTAEAVDPLTRHWTWHVGGRLDRAAMARVAGLFVGEHDFSSFCRSREGSTNVRMVYESTLLEDEDILEYWVTANAFCHQMVRSLVGYLYDIGRGFSPEDRAGDVIAARDRSRVATVAPPHGLVLWEVGYAETVGRVRPDSPRVPS